MTALAILLAAIIVVPLVAHPTQELAPRATALVAATIVTRFTKRASIVIGAGMATFWVLATQVR